MWRIEFTTDKFLPTLPEECQTNPGAYGFELALWLAHQLLRNGIVTSYPQSEDWGWFIEFTDEAETEIQIGCSSMASHGDGYQGKPIEWSVFIKPHSSLRERLKGVTHSEKVNRLGARVVELLTSIGASPRLEPD
jgi:hypothetical protein